MLPAVSSTAAPPEAATPLIHVVQAGDTLATIAERYGTSPAAIQQVNQLDDVHLIWPGQALIMPAGGDAPPATPAALTEGGMLHNGVPCPQEIPPVPDEATLIGRSAVCKLPIVSYQLGDGDIPVVLVGGMHGGYEWNTIALAYEMLAYLRGFPATIPAGFTIHLIPNANPDGLYAVSRSVGRPDRRQLDDQQLPGRVNGRGIDLNRNWDCLHTPYAVWRDQPVDGGAFPFSEPETVALRDFLLAVRPAAVLFWHSAATGVYAAGCGAPDPSSQALATAVGLASGYPIYDQFTHYQVTGDASDWLAAQGIPAITVELSDHVSLNWDMNLAGLRAFLAHAARRSPAQ